MFEFVAQRVEFRGVLVVLPAREVVDDAAHGSLRNHGYIDEATAVAAIRREASWSTYTIQLLANIQAALRSHGNLDALRFLLYPSRLTAAHRAAVHGSPGVKWLAKEE